MYFRYGETEMTYLRERDARLGHIMDQIGPIERPMDPDLFSAVVHQIAGQQISSKAHATVWLQLKALLGDVTAESIYVVDASDLQSCGISGRKAGYIKDFAEKVHNGQFDPETLVHMSDADAIEALSSLRGVGVWTAEMILLFCLGRPDILSWNDFGIRRGLRMIYGLEEITRPQFEKYRALFSPYGSTASLYLWAVSGGQIPELTDPAHSNTNKKKQS